MTARVIPRNIQRNSGVRKREVRAGHRVESMENSQIVAVDGLLAQRKVQVTEQAGCHLKDELMKRAVCEA